MKFVVQEYEALWSLLEMEPQNIPPIDVWGGQELDLLDLLLEICCLFRISTLVYIRERQQQKPEAGRRVGVAE